MKAISKGLMAASNKPLILSILMQGENYGYEILLEIERLTNGELDWSDGMLYPLLHKMASDGLIQWDWRILDNGRKRKYYSITNLGIEALKTEKEHWEFMNVILQKSWNKLKTI